jgi:hypothetical protein
MDMLHGLLQQKELRIALTLDIRCLSISLIRPMEQRMGYFLEKGQRKMLIKVHMELKGLLKDEGERKNQVVG